MYGVRVRLCHLMFKFDDSTKAIKILLSFAFYTSCGFYRKEAAGLQQGLTSTWSWRGDVLHGC